MMQLYKQYRVDGNYVSLDGHGPDEELCGYGNFLYMAFLDTNPLHFNEIMNIVDTYKTMYPVKDNFLKLRPGGYFSYFKTHVWHQLQQRKPLLPQETSDLAQHRDAIQHMGHFNYGLYKLFHYSIFPTLLRNYDRYSMRSGVEMRMPFVDHRLVAYSYSIPWQSKLRKVFNKAILRDAVAPILDKSIAYRRTKIGFTSPLPQWFNGSWKDWLDDTIHSTDFKNCDLVNHTTATMAYNRFRHKAQLTVIEGEELWLQISPYLWQEHFFKRATQQT
jgi:asparagine synthase (glutamine-hydrolysing)